MNRIINTLTFVPLILVLVLLTGCGGGGGDDALPEPTDKTSLAWKQWLWAVEGGDPAQFTLDKFCHKYILYCRRDIDIPIYIPYPGAQIQPPPRGCTNATGCL